MTLFRVVVVGVCLSLVATGGQNDAAKELKKLDGLWLLEEGEQNGKTFGPRQGEEAIYIENKTVLWTNKDGTARGGQMADISVDPSKKPKTIDYRFTRGNYNGHKMFGIYKLEGDKLIIAFNNPEKDQRPTKFTTRLTAGAARAQGVRTYIKAKDKD